MQSYVLSACRRHLSGRLPKNVRHPTSRWSDVRPDLQIGELPREENYPSSLREDQSRGYTRWIEFSQEGETASVALHQTVWMANFYQSQLISTQREGNRREIAWTPLVSNGFPSSVSFWDLEILCAFGVCELPLPINMSGFLTLLELYTT